MRVTAVFLSYNCEAFVADALRSLLEQDVSEPMDIIVSDDASTDSTFGILEQTLLGYRGPHRIRTFRRPTNCGSKSGHLNHVLPLASGEMIVSFDSDDIAEPFRVRRIVEVFDESPSFKAVYSEFSIIDEAGTPRGTGGVPHPPPETPARCWFAQVDAYAAGATLAVRRDVITAFPPLDPSVHEDVVLPFRASLLGEVAFIDEPLVRARRHAGSLTADFSQFASLENFRVRMLRGIERAHANFDSRLRDVDVVRRNVPERQRDWDEVERIAVKSIETAEMTAPLFSPRFGDRCVALARLIGARAYPGDLCQNIALAFAPAAYIRYKRRRLFVRAGGT